MNKKKSKWFTLSDLKEDRQLLRTLQNEFRKNEPKKQKKKKPVTARVVGSVTDRKYPEVASSVSDLKKCESLLLKCMEMLGDKIVAYEAITLTLSHAYSQPTTQPLKISISKARKLCSSFQKREATRQRAKERMFNKGLPTKAINAGLKKYPPIDPTPLLDLIQDSLTKVSEELNRLGGTYYTNRPKTVEIDLSEWDSKGSGVVMTRVPLLIGVKAPLDLAALKREVPELQLQHMESFLYDFKNALVIGLTPSAIPKNITVKALSSLVASNFRLVAQPLTTKLTHPSSKRVWFMVPEFTAQFRYCKFADRELTQEFGGLKFLPVNPTEDDIRFVFQKEGFPAEELESLLARYFKITSARDRIQLLYREYQAFTIRQRTKTLAQRRERFLADNQELLSVIRRLEEDVDTYRTLTKDFRDEFKKLTSPTGKPEDGLPIANFKHIPDVFRALTRSSVRGVKDSDHRIRTRQIMVEDRRKAWEMYFTYQELAAAAKYARDKLKLAKNTLAHNLEKANGHVEQQLDTVEG